MTSSHAREPPHPSSVPSACTLTSDAAHPPFEAVQSSASQQEACTPFQSLPRATSPAKMSSDSPSLGGGRVRAPAAHALTCRDKSMHDRLFCSCGDSGLHAAATLPAARASSEHTSGESEGPAPRASTMVSACCESHERLQPLHSALSTAMQPERASTSEPEAPDTVGRSSGSQRAGSMNMPRASEHRMACLRSSAPSGSPSRSMRMLLWALLMYAWSMTCASQVIQCSV
mmetsp:Transcript_33862/g.86810  ORF Transcript_33862/g.86810 Transcript_33862/m.86810 type:complete len:230 (+) Transcript_33862:745-1434(+)